MNDSPNVKKRTLIDALDKLKERACIAEELSALSKNLIEKFERTENIPKLANENGGIDKSSKEPDLIDLFDQVNHRLDIALNNIGANINRARDFIG